MQTLTNEDAARMVMAAAKGIAAREEDLAVDLMQIATQLAPEEMEYQEALDAAVAEEVVAVPAPEPKPAKESGKKKAA